MSRLSIPKVLVAIQFFLLACIAFSAEWRSFVFVRGAILFFALGVAISAVFAMRFRFSVFPVADGVQKVVDHGIYHWVRHPMYLSLLLITVATLPIAPARALVHLTLLIALAANLWAKASLEEQALSAKFPEYENYSKRTKRIIPWVW